jgi:hypothetical protein
LRLLSARNDGCRGRSVLRFFALIVDRPLGLASLALAYPPERTFSRWDEFAGQLNAIDLSKLKKLLTNLNIRLRTA